MGLGVVFFISEIIAVPFLISYLLYLFFRDDSIRKDLYDSERYKNIDNFIEIKKNYYNGIESILGVLLGIIVAFFIGLKDLSNIGPIGYSAYGGFFLLCLFLFLFAGRLKRKIIKKLYEKKENQEGFNQNS